MPSTTAAACKGAKQVQRTCRAAAGRAGCKEDKCNVRRRRRRVRSPDSTGCKGSINTSPAAGRPRACAATATWCTNREPKEAPISA
eukprot:scaffold71352_cov71-Phaeocystis_antarctica.AAC.2